MPDSNSMGPCWRARYHTDIVAHGSVVTVDPDGDGWCMPCLTEEVGPDRGLRYKQYAPPGGRHAGYDYSEAEAWVAEVDALVEAEQGPQCSNCGGSSGRPVTTDPGGTLWCNTCFRAAYFGATQPGRDDADPSAWWRWWRQAREAQIQVDQEQR